MADIKDYGELYTSDILVVGGGMAGLVTAIRAKENDPTLDILVIDKGIIGWNGQATKDQVSSILTGYGQPHPNIRMV